MAEFTTTTQARSFYQREDRPYQCHTCGNSFAKSEHLVRHVRSHTKEKPFRCSDCGSGYSRQWVTVAYIATVVRWPLTLTYSDILLRHRRDVRCKESNRARKSRSKSRRTQQHSNSPAPLSAQSVSEQLPSQLLSTPASTIENDLANQNHGPIFSANNNYQSLTDRLDPTTLLTDSNSSDPGFVDFAPHEFQTDPLNRGDLFMDEEFAVADDFFPFLVPQNLHDDLLNSQMFFDEPSSLPGRPSAPLQSKPPDMHNVKQLWFTNIAAPKINELYPEAIPNSNAVEESVPTSPQPPSDEIDIRQLEKFRQLLQMPARELTLPPLEHLNLCLRLYFTKVHPMFPLIHVGTFRPCRANGPLVIIMCAIGSIFTGFDAAFKQGLHLYDRLQKSILLKWETAAAKDQESQMITIQVALIGQLFGMLSGIPNLLITVDCLHGLIIAWARHFGSCRPLPPVRTELSVGGAQLESVWRKWARCEEWIRIAHCLYILDSELAHLVHRETLQSFTAYPHRLTSSNEAFAARNARDWREEYLRDLELSPTPSSVWEEWRTVSPQNPDVFRRIPSTCGLTSYTVLQSLGTDARCLHRLNTLDRSNLEGIITSLVIFRKSVFTNAANTVQMELQMHILWHVTFVAALANLDLLERSVGRDGNALNLEDQSEVVSWANSSDGARCILHALMIGKYTQSMTISQAMALHVPRAVFWASLAISTFVRFKVRSSLATTFADHHFEEIDPAQLEEARLLSTISGAETALKLATSTMRDLLQHHGHWGLCRRFASILNEIVRSEGGYS